MARFIRFPWATTGDKAEVPFDTDPGGSVSYAQGFGPDYEIAPGDPGWKPVPRDETNGFYNDLTDNIRQYQLNGAPDWHPAADNDGISINYPINSVVRWSDLLWRSLIANNTVEPGTDATKWAALSVFAVATDAEVQAGVVTDRIVTPAGLSSRSATLTRTGLVELATQAEAETGTDTGRVPAVNVLAASVRKAPWSYAEAAGTANALTATLSPAPASLTDLLGAELRVKIATTNTGAATLNVNGLGAVAIVGPDLQSLPASTLIAGVIVSMIYDGTQFQSSVGGALTAPPASGTSVAVALGATRGLFDIKIGLLRSSSAGAACGIDVSFNGGSSWTVVYQDNINAPGENASILLAVGGGVWKAVIVQSNSLNVSRSDGSTGTVTALAVRARASSGNVQYEEFWIRKSS
jgi:hypothetical protein